MWGEGCFRLVCRRWGDGRLHAIAARTRAGRSGHSGWWRGLRLAHHASRQDSAGRSSGPSVKRVEKLGGSATQVMLANKSCFVTL
jgi:hypothetical protein